MLQFVGVDALANDDCIIDYDTEDKDKGHHGQGRNRDIEEGE